MGYWSKYIFGKWPLLFPLKQAFRLGGALLYAAVMLLTVIWHSAQVYSPFSSLLSWTVVGLGSILTWWLSISFAVAVNENRWFTGGYLTLIFYLLWHGIVVLGYAILSGTGPRTPDGIPEIYYLVSDLFLIYVVVVICGCNTSQTIIAIAEPLRRENERGDIRMAIRVFQEFKKKTFGVSLFNYIPMVSAKPVFYYWIFGGALVIVAVNIYEVMTVLGADVIYRWVFLLRNVSALVLVAWLMIWYASAFTYLQKEVYKR